MMCLSRVSPFVIAFIFLAAVCWLTGPTAADLISGDAMSPSFVPAMGGSFTPSHLVSPPVTYTGFPAVDTDAFSFGRTQELTTYRFSVDRGSAGAMGTAVFAQSSAGLGETAYADVFVANPFTAPGVNTLLLDGDGSAAPPTSGPVGGLVEGPPGMMGPTDNVDALEARVTGAAGFWSVTPATITSDPTYAPASPADVFVSSPFAGTYPTGPAGGTLIYALEAALGLLPGDDIDALEVIDVGSPMFGDLGDTVIFSLAPGSPTLLAGFSPADILFVVPGGMPSLLASATSLGLLPTDNLNALSSVPEPSALACMAVILGLAGTSFVSKNWLRLGR